MPKRHFRCGQCEKPCYLTVEDTCEAIVAPGYCPIDGTVESDWEEVQGGAQTEKE